jgi:hypothetical protein
MLQVLRTTRAYVAFVTVAVGSTVMYCNHLNRAVGEAGLCKAVEKHVVELNTGPDGAIPSHALGLVDSIQDRCEISFSRKQARCILNAGSMTEVRACRR